MRDVDKLREKIELSLDNRQVVSLVIGALVVLGVVFVLGVMVGKQIAPQGQSAPQDLLGTLDRAATDAGTTAPNPPLTFQQELTKPVTTAPTVPAPSSEARAAKTAERPTPKLDPRPTEAKPEKPEPKVEAKVEKPEPKAEPKPEPKAEKPEKVAAKEPEPKPAEKAEPPAPALDHKLADAFSAAKKETPKVAAAVPAPTSGFTVQVAASQSKDDADAVMTKLRNAGLRPYLVDAEIPGKGHWYRVRVGAFHSRDDADKYVHDLKRETGLSAFVTPVK